MKIDEEHENEDEVGDGQVQRLWNLLVESWPGQRKLSGFRPITLLVQKPLSANAQWHLHPDIVLLAPSLGRHLETRGAFFFLLCLLG